MFLSKFKKLFQFREVRGNGDVVYPGLESVVEEFFPLVTDVKYRGPAEK